MSLLIFLPAGSALFFFFDKSVLKSSSMAVHLSVCPCVSISFSSCLLFLFSTNVLSISNNFLVCWPLEHLSPSFTVPCSEVCSIWIKTATPMFHYLFICNILRCILGRQYILLSSCWSTLSVSAFLNTKLYPDLLKILKNNHDILVSRGPTVVNNIQ